MAGFVLGSRKSIIIDFMAISQKIIYTLLSSFMNRRLTGIRSDRNLPPILLLFDVLEHMCLTTFSDETNTSLKSVQLMVTKVLMFHENTELLPSGDRYDLSLGNNESTKHITPVLVGIPVRNQPDLVKVSKEGRV